MLLILLMSKGSKEALTVLIVTHVTHVERVESGVCGLYTQYTYIPSNAMYVEGIESYFDFWPLRHALIYIALDGMVGMV